MMRNEKNAKMHWMYEEDTWNKVRENKEKEKEIRESELGSEEKVEKGEEQQQQRRRRRRRRRKKQKRRKKRSREKEGEKWIIFQRNNDHTIPHEKILRDHFVYLGKLNSL